jgi:hypothetical protein
MLDPVPASIITSSTSAQGKADRLWSPAAVCCVRLRRMKREDLYELDMHTLLSSDKRLMSLVAYAYIALCCGMPVPTPSETARAMQLCTHRHNRSRVSLAATQSPAAPGSCRQGPPADAAPAAGDNIGRLGSGPALGCEEPPSGSQQAGIAQLGQPPANAVPAPVPAIDYIAEVYRVGYRRAQTAAVSVSSAGPREEHRPPCCSRECESYWPDGDKQLHAADSTSGARRRRRLRIASDTVAAAVAAGGAAAGSGSVQGDDAEDRGRPRRARRGDAAASTQAPAGSGHGQSPGPGAGMRTPRRRAAQTVLLPRVAEGSASKKSTLCRRLF